MMPPIIEVQQLSKNFPGANAGYALNDINFSIQVR